MFKLTLILLLLCNILKFMCKHNYQKVAFTEHDDGRVRYTIRTYKCKECGKEVKVDGRFDPFVKY